MPREENGKRGSQILIDFMILQKTKAMFWNKEKQEKPIKKQIRGDFEITINDGFCTWKMGLTFKNSENTSIDDIWHVLKKHFKSKHDNGELIDPK